ETLESRLHHVLRVYLPGEQAIEPAAGQRDEPSGEPLEDVSRGRVFAGAEPGHQEGERFGVGHGPSRSVRAATFRKFLGRRPHRPGLTPAEPRTTGPRGRGWPAWGYGSESRIPCGPGLPRAYPDVGRSTSARGLVAQVHPVIYLRSGLPRGQAGRDRVGR